MTESEYLASTDPAALLLFLEGKLSERRLRLFACGCSRQNWDLLPAGSRQSVETAERYAEGLVGKVELAVAHRGGYEITRRAKSGLQCIVIDEAEVCSLENTAYVAEYPTREKPGVPLPIQAALLRDIAGNPFRPVVFRTIQVPRPSWALHPDVLGIAEAIYEERAFDRMPILADALEEAGCPMEERCPDCDMGCARWSPHIDRAFKACERCQGAGRLIYDLLAHCRGQERCPECRGYSAIKMNLCCTTCDEYGWIPLRVPCVRGCWILDLLLGKS